MKYLHYKHQELEPEIIQFWQKQKIVEKLRQKNKKGKKFYFLDGPPYTSGKFHLGHAWNYALKDLALRYKRMQGLNVWDRNGFDVHGLPTEHKVMDKYGLKTKEDIEKFGVDKFVRECEKFCLKMAKVMTADLVRMGITVSHENPYMALKPEYIEGEWDLIKKAYAQKRLYYGEKVLTWCQHCETAVAKHECEYKNVQEKSIFVKFPLKDKKNEFLIIWTTTPWTIPFNLAVMANPEIDYVKVEVEGEKWILAKALAGIIAGSLLGKKIQVLEEFKGKELEGLEYKHPLERFIPAYAELKKEHQKVHTVILSEQYVDTTAGSGLVHAAPGCGPEDQEVCRQYQIPPFNNLSEDGYFPAAMGPFQGLRAKVDDEKFVEALKNEKALLTSTMIEHDYPHCWRCKKPVIFRITNQWFFKVEDLRKKILQGNKKVQWVPDTALHAYESWIKNLKDNSITRQRYWGTPVPIWRCETCEKVKVIGSKEEIRKNCFQGTKVPENLHLPWIDQVKLKCSCGKEMRRIPDIIDVWVDAGTASWNCLYNDTQKIKQWYPADLILEAKEQTRLWFSMLSICSYLYRGDNAFRNVYVYGMLNDIEGKKMSKSIGNIISPYELIDKYGVDVLRYYMCQNNAGQDINFSWDECKVKERQLHILWNVHKFLINLALENKINPAKLKFEQISKSIGQEEEYIFSKLHSTIKTVTELLENYHFDETILPLEELFLELSRTYIQMVREKSSVGSKEEKEVCLYTIYHVLLEFLKMFNIIAPFICEAIYQNLKINFGSKEESISHYSWPKAEQKKILKKLEQEMETAKQIMQAILFAREKAQLGVRWPLQKVIVINYDPKNLPAIKRLKDIIQQQTNIKDITVKEELPGLKLTIKPNPGKIGPVYAGLSPKICSELKKIKPEKIIAALQKEKKFIFILDQEKQKEKQKITIVQEMIVLEKDVPAGFSDAEYKGGRLYLDVKLTFGLETEGYVRELTRFIQQLRKEAGLEKTNRINLIAQMTESMAERMKPFLAEMKEKVGAKEIEIKVESTEKRVRQFQHQGEVKIKTEKFAVGFDLV